MADLEYVYHYTASFRWKAIKKSGYLKLTPSNLKNLKNPRYVKNPDGTIGIVDETDDYKPVVWLTESETGENMGNFSPEKMELQIAIPYNKDKHHWWVTWKDKNKADKKAVKMMTSNGEKYGSWYVCEEVIPLEEIAFVKEMATGKIIYQKKK